jgi:hypothetical protein
MENNISLPFFSSIGMWLSRSRRAISSFLLHTSLNWSLFRIEGCTSSSFRPSNGPNVTNLTRNPPTNRIELQNSAFEWWKSQVLTLLPPRIMGINKIRSNPLQRPFKLKIYPIDRALNSALKKPRSKPFSLKNLW